MKGFAGFIVTDPRDIALLKENHDREGSEMTTRSVVEWVCNRCFDRRFGNDLPVGWERVEGLGDEHKCRSCRVEDLCPQPPMLSGETTGQYTDRLTGADGTGRRPYKDRNRQCSIGFHEECSDPEGEECKCPCHTIPMEDDELEW